MTNQFGARSQFDDRLNFGNRKRDPQGIKSEAQQVQKLAQSTFDIPKENANMELVDMVMTSQKIDDRLSQLNRIRTAINFNEFLRLPALVIAVAVGIKASLLQKPMLVKIVDVET